MPISRFLYSESDQGEQFGDSVALYFFFLVAYTRALIFPSALGVIFYFFGTPYSVIYSTILFIWSVVFVEWWRLQERILSVRWCTRGSFRVEKRRADFVPGLRWWRKESRKMASIPVILLFASVLAVVLTGVFMLEAFVTQLYKGPGSRIVVSCLKWGMFWILTPSLSQRLSFRPFFSQHWCHSCLECTRPVPSGIRTGKITRTNPVTQVPSASNCLLYQLSTLISVLRSLRSSMSHSETG